MFSDSFTSTHNQLAPPTLVFGLAALAIFALSIRATVVLGSLALIAERASGWRVTQGAGRARILRRIPHVLVSPFTGLGAL
jgi:hypothetical protein